MILGANAMPTRVSRRTGGLEIDTLSHDLRSDVSRRTGGLENFLRMGQ